MDFLSRLFDPAGFIPRAQCGEWTAGLILLHTISDTLIWLAYLAIPVVLIYFIRKRRDLPFPWMFWLFGAFIVSCGFTHFLEVVIFYSPVYRLAGVLKLVTAVASWATVFALIRIVPRALAMRSPEALEREVGARTADLARINAALHAEIAERRRVEQTLVGERERFRLTLASIGDGVLATDSDGSVTFLNGVACSLTGWGEAEALGKPIDEVFRAVGEFTRTPSESPAARALREGRAVAMSNSMVLIARDGTERPIDNCGAPIRDKAGVTGAVLVFRDVTERRRAAEAHDRLAAIVESSADAIFGDTLDGVITSWNAAAERLFGYTAVEALQRPITLIIPPDRAEEMHAILERVCQGERVAPFETVRLRRDGSSVEVSLSVSPVRDVTGRVVGVARVARDITPQKQAEAALKREQEFLRAVLESIQEAVVACHSDGSLRFLNAATRRLSGAGQKWFPNQDWTEHYQVFQADGQTPMQSEELPLNRALRGEVIRDLELVLTPREGGQSHTLVASGQALLDSQGQKLGAVVALYDITERRQLEQQFAQSQKMEAFGQMAGGVAHDFNNLLTVILGFGEILLEKLPANDPAREMVTQMTKAGERAAGLTRQLLAFSRKSVLAPKVLSLNVVVGEVDKMLRRLIGEDIEILTRLQPDLDLVKADPGLMEQVVLNLAVNARDAMPRGGKLTIETRNIQFEGEEKVTVAGVVPAGAYVWLSVSDTGTGMSVEVKARIFEPFFTTKESGRGTGLGLAMVFGTVQQNGGYIDVTSAPGAGSTFDVYLPRLEEPAEPIGPQTRSATAPRGSETVLVVEDEEWVRGLIRTALQTKGYVVLEAAHGREAIRLATEHTGAIQLLVSDVVMPELGGRELAEQLMEIHPEMKLLFVSGYTEDAILRHGVSVESLNFLQKPFSMAALAQKVREVLDEGAVR